MPIKYESGTLKVSFGYGLKLNRGDYQSEDAHSSVSMEFDIEGDPVAVLEEAIAVESKLAQHAKLAVFAELGIESFTEVKEGVLAPKLPTPPAAAPSQPSTAGVGAKKNYAPFGGGGQGGGQFAPPKADLTQQPVVALFGKAYYDQRSLKADGTYKQGAADFRSVADRSDQLWLAGRDGTVNADVAAELEKAGVAVV